MKRSKTPRKAAAKPTRRPTARKTAKRAPAPSTGHRAPKDFAIIGVGASAGGLEALQELIQSMPTRCDAALIIVQHLDPSNRGLLPELLQRMTPLRVVEASEGTVVECEHIYVIPPGKDMSLLHGSLHLLPQASNRGRVLPIDFFFRSLAQDQGERSIGVILSGMGSDGTLGLRAIKEAAGATFVQAPETAKFDGMPRSAITAGLADVVASAGELPGRIFAYRDHAPFAGAHGEIRGSETASVLEKICVLLREHSGNDFSVYKRSTIHRRIERRMGLQDLDSFAAYLAFLRENPRELELLFSELLIGVTSFFRDPGEWDRLRTEVLPQMVAVRGASSVLRAWVAGCSTGEEAYSLAILMKEAVEPIRRLKNITIQIFATDLDRAAIDYARHGLYPENIAADVSPDRLRRFFVREEGGYRVSKEIRECVVFAPQNVIMDPPFTKVDILTCRNLLIYLSADVQKKLIPLFHYCLAFNGALFLGSAETVGPFTSLFTPLDSRTRVYRRLEHSVANGAFPVDVQLATVARGNARPERDDATMTHAKAAMNLQTLVDRLLVQRFAPLGVLCNPKGDVLYVSGRAVRYLEPPVGKANLNVFAMAREGLRYELSTTFAKALRSGRPATARNIKIGTNGGAHHVDLTVERLSEPKELDGTMIVVFAEAAVAPPASDKTGKGDRTSRRHAAAAEDELRRSRDEIQTMREEMQTSQEELRSTNEELQSTNEELQSANEELTTSKEEMQSLNEELQTVNHELQSKVDELSRSNNDMKNLLDSTNIATLFLDDELRVRRFTTATAQIIKLIPADVGRAIMDIASDLDYPDLVDDAREVLRTLIYKERQAIARSGRSYAVRVMPYRTIDNVIDGVVITFMDTTEARTLALAAKEQASELRQMAESLPNLVWGARPDGAIDFLTNQWVEYTGVSSDEQVAWGWLDQVHPGDRDRVREEWRHAVRSGARFDSEFRIRSASGAYFWFKTRSVPIRDSSGRIVKWYGTSTEIDSYKRSEERLLTILDSIGEACLGVDESLVIRTANEPAAVLLGTVKAQLTGATLFEVLPAAREREADIRGAPSQLTFDLDASTHVTAHVQRDHEGGFWLFMREDAG